MDKLEHYLDQVCRSIGGPRPLRQHVRQELREHLLDAVALHRAAGMSEEDALSKALEEFGKPEEVRSELEATHGQRMMAVVIDKAMQWKEVTMKAKWLWTTWAYLGLAVVIVLEVGTATGRHGMEQLLEALLTPPPGSTTPQPPWAAFASQNDAYGHLKPDRYGVLWRSDRVAFRACASVSRM